MEIGQGGAAHSLLNFGNMGIVAYQPPGVGQIGMEAAGHYLDGFIISIDSRITEPVVAEFAVPYLGSLS
ncbi:hypothetical protein D3C76_1441720 [compost metagenome]